MSFPADTKKQARWVADQIKKRYKRRNQQIEALYHGKFLHLNYGFGELLKNNKAAAFMHELETTVDCFSASGVLYAVADELNLQPEMFWARDMTDRVHGVQKELYDPMDHAFITVQHNGDRFVVDPLTDMLAKIRSDDTHLLLERENSDTLDKERVSRKYTSMKQASVDDFVSEVNRRKTPAGIRNVLCAPQKLTSRKHNILTQLTDTNLITLFYSNNAVELREESPRQYVTLQVTTPTNNSLSFQDATLTTRKVRDYSMSTAVEQDPHNNISFPYRYVKQVWNVIDEITKANGRKTSVRKTTIPVAQIPLQKAGVSAWADKNSALVDLVDEVCEHTNITNFDITNPYTKQRIAYDNARFENNNKFVYSLDTRKEYLEDILEISRNNLSTKVDMLTHRIRTEARLDSEFDMSVFKNQQHKYQESPARRIERLILDYNNNKHLLDESLDQFVFYENNPADSIILSENATARFQRRQVFSSILNAGFIPGLTLPEYQTAINKLLT